MPRTNLLCPAPLTLAALLAVCAIALPASSEETRNSGPTSKSTSTKSRPDYVQALERAYGAPSQAAFGSAVFYETKASGDLAKAALGHCKYFTGKLWEQYGEAAWMGPWREVYARKPGTKADIVAELRGIQDADAKISAPMVLDVVQDADAARTALAGAG